MSLSRPRLLPAVLPAIVAVAFAAASLGQAPPPPAKLAPADGAPGDLFGCALDLDQEGQRLTAVIPSLLDDDRGRDSGSLYVFERQGEGWRQTTKLVASGSAAGDELGFSVALDRGLLVAGAPKSGRAGTSSGAAWAFRRAADGWVEQGVLLPPGVEAFDQLGHAVAVSAGSVALGAPGDDDQGPVAGAVYLLEGEGLAGVTKLTAVGSEGSGMGFSLAFDGDRLVAGAPFDDLAGPQAGAAFVFERGPLGWELVAQLVAASRRPASLFGTSVSTSGDRVAVGARLDDAAGRNSGAVYVFRRIDGGFELEAVLAPAGLEAGDELGVSVALEGGVLVAGARFDDDAAPDAGAVYRFERREGIWVETDKRTQPGAGAGDELGYAVALAADTVLAGAYRADVAGGDSGQACAFGQPEPPPPPPPPPPPSLPQALLTLELSATPDLVVAGGSIDYTLVVANVGTGGTAATVQDLFPAGLACTWTCAPSGTATCAAGPVMGDLLDSVFLPRRTSLTYVATCMVGPSVSGRLDNTATVTGGGQSEAATVATPVTAFIPTLSEWRLVLLALLLAAAACWRLRA